MGVINGGKYRMSMCSSPLLTPHSIQLQPYSTNHSSFPSPIVNAISSHDAFSHAVPSARNFLLPVPLHLAQPYYIAQSLFTCSVSSCSVPWRVWHSPTRILNTLYGNLYLIYISFFSARHEERAHPCIICVPNLFMQHNIGYFWLNVQMNKMEWSKKSTRS